MIAPAISVLSAIEGLKVDAPGLAPMVFPITIAILASLFLVQRRGTEFIGSIFGPVMLVWFVAIGLLGLPPPPKEQTAPRVPVGEVAQKRRVRW